MEIEAEQLVELLKKHLAVRPGMEARDLYKLLFQSVCGPEHLITSPDVFTARLAAEWESLDRAGDDPLWESIRPDGSLLRLNLRPYKNQGGEVEKLAAACLETARRTWGTRAELQQAWEGVFTACKAHPWPGLSLEGIEAFTSWLAANGYPPVHHSEEYRRLYRPAYRLVAADGGVLALR